MAYNTDTRGALRVLSLAPHSVTGHVIDGTCLVEGFCYFFLSADSLPTDSVPTAEGLILSFKACQTASRQPPDSLLSLQISTSVPITNHADA